jgi:hypothetical protein
VFVAPAHMGVSPAINGVGRERVAYDGSADSAQDGSREPPAIIVAIPVAIMPIAAMPVVVTPSAMMVESVMAMVPVKPVTVKVSMMHYKSRCVGRSNHC